MIESAKVGVLRMPFFTRSVAVSHASAGLVRFTLTAHIIKWEIETVADTALLVMSELFNNAVQATTIAQSLTVHATFANGKLVLAVKDPSKALPEKKPTISTMEQIDSCEESELGGWGLALIEALCERAWITHEEDGKWVCAEIKV